MRIGKHPMDRAVNTHGAGAGRAGAGAGAGQGGGCTLM